MMLAPIAETVAQAAPGQELPLDLFFPFFFPGCGCRVSGGGGTLPMSAVLLLVLAFVVVKLGCFARRR